MFAQPRGTESLGFQHISYKYDSKVDTEKQFVVERTVPMWRGSRMCTVADNKPSGSVKSGAI
jgi:hypothetical protein